MNAALFRIPRTSTAAEAAQLTDFNDFVDAAEKRRAFRETRTELAAELLEAQRAAADGQPDDDDIRSEARARFEGRDYTARPGAGAELARLERAVSVARQAENLAKQEYQEVRLRRSLEICNTVRPRHATLVDTIGALVAALEHACAAEADLLDGLRASGVEILPHLLPAMDFIPTVQAGGERAAPQARAWFARAKQLGFFQNAECLSDLRKAR